MPARVRASISARANSNSDPSRSQASRLSAFRLRRSCSSSSALIALPLWRDAAPPRSPGAACVGSSSRMPAPRSPAGRPLPSRRAGLCGREGWFNAVGEPDPAGAGTIADRHAGRRAIEENFKTPKQGTRIEDRRQGRADDLRKRPALNFLDRDEFAALCIGMRDCGFRDIQASPFGEAAFDDLTIRQAAVDIARFVGFIPSKRQDLPGTEMMREGMTCMLKATAIYRAIRSVWLLTGSTAE